MKQFNNKFNVIFKMLKIIFLLFAVLKDSTLLLHLNEKNPRHNAIIHSKNSLNALEKGDLYSEYTDSEYGLYFNSEDTPDPDIHYSSLSFAYGESFTHNMDDEDDDTNALATIRILINGTTEDVRKIKRQHILASLWIINSIELTLNKKLVIWDIVKNNNSVKTLKRVDLQATGNILLSIPEIDLYNLNYSDWDTVDYLGTLPGLTRRQVGIIGYALKERWGNNITKQVPFLNKLKGLICAFPPNELVDITPAHFLELKKGIFENIRACTEIQKQVLLHTALLSNAYGPVQTWTVHDINKLALLITAMKLEDFTTIRTGTMEGIEFKTIEAMTKDQLEQFNSDQLSYLTDLSLAAYRRQTGIKSNNDTKIYCLKLLILLCPVISIRFHF